MRNLRFLIVFVFLVLSSVMVSGQETYFQKVNSFMEKYVSNGKVDYALLKASSDNLESLVEQISTFNVEAVSKQTQKAYYINSYNLLVIKGIIDNYPVQSPQEVNGFFDTKKYVVAGKKLTLNAIENDVLRKNFSDVRLHFVLVCGAIGCPPITSFAYTPDKLDAQLTAQTRKSINGSFIQLKEGDKKVLLSEIVSWYKPDFTMDGKKVLETINEFRDAKIPMDYKIGYFPYNWQLNQVSSASLNSSDQGGEVNNNAINLQDYTAGSLLPKGGIDVTVFNSLYTQTASTWEGQTYTGNRETFMASTIQFLYGVNKNARVNIGLDVNIRANARSVDSTSASLTAPLVLSNTDSTRFGITSVGFKVRLSPFTSANNFTMQSTVFVPTIPNPEGLSGDPDPSKNRYWAEWSRIVWWNQFFYTNMLAEKLQLFTEVDLLFRFPVFKGQYTHVDVPASVFLSYFPTKKATVYVMGQYTSRMISGPLGDPAMNTDWVIPSDFAAVGVGMKYQISKRINLELLHTNFFHARNAGLGKTFNVGIKYLR